MTSLTVVPCGAGEARVIDLAAFRDRRKGRPTDRRVRRGYGNASSVGGRGWESATSPAPSGSFDDNPRGAA